MTEQRKQYLDSLWVNSEVGRWAIAEAEGNKAEADGILETLFKKGYMPPLEHLVEQEKALSQKVKKELKNTAEGKEYCIALEKTNNTLVEVMIAYGFSMLDLFYE